MPGGRMAALQEGSPHRRDADPVDNGGYALPRQGIASKPTSAGTISFNPHRPLSSQAQGAAWAQTPPAPAGGVSSSTVLGLAVEEAGDRTIVEHLADGPGDQWRDRKDRQL